MGRPGHIRCKSLEVSLFHRHSLRRRRYLPVRIIEEGLEDGIHFGIEKDDVAAIGEDKALAVGEVVMDTVDVKRAAGGVELTVAEEGGLVSVKGLFGSAVDRWGLPAVADLAVDIIDVIAAHIGVEVG